MTFLALFSSFFVVIAATFEYVSRKKDCGAGQQHNINDTFTKGRER